MDIITLKTAFYESMVQILDQSLLDQLYSLYIFLQDKKQRQIKYYLYRFMHNIPHRNNYKPQDVQRFKDTIRQVAESPNAYYIIQPVIARIFNEQQQNITKIQELLDRHSVVRSQFAQCRSQMMAGLGEKAKGGLSLERLHDIMRSKVQSIRCLNVYCEILVKKLYLAHNLGKQVKISRIEEDFHQIRADGDQKCQRLAQLINLRANYHKVRRTLLQKQVVGNLQFYRDTLKSRLRVLNIIRNTYVE